MLKKDRLTASKKTETEDVGFDSKTSSGNLNRRLFLKLTGAAALLGAGLVLPLKGFAHLTGSTPNRPGFEEDSANNLFYNGELNYKNEGWYLNGSPVKGPFSNWEAGQQLEPYRLNVQGGKSYVLEFDAGLSQGNLEWLWLDDGHQPVGVLQNITFVSNFTTHWNPGKVHDERAAPPGAAYLRLIFRPTSPGQVAKFRFYDDSVRLEPLPDYARAALSFTFDWETAMGGLIHSQGGSPGNVGAESSGQELNEASLKAGISYAEERGQRMREGTDYLLELFTRNGVKGTFYGNGYNFLSGNPAKKTFVGNPTYKWATPKNGWSSPYWLTHPWYSLDPYGDYQHNPQWYFDDQTARLHQAGQNIESHTFGHVYVRGTSVQEFADDTKALAELAAQKGLPPMRHFAFPWTSSNSVGKEWYQVLIDHGFNSITRLYPLDQSINYTETGMLHFDNGQRQGGKILFDDFAGPANTYFYLGREPKDTRLYVVSDFKLVTTPASENQAYLLIDQLIKRRGYGSIWTHPEETVVDRPSADEWQRVIEYAVSQRAIGLWLDSVANIIQYTQDISKLEVRVKWADNGKTATITLTNTANRPLKGITLTFPALPKEAPGAVSIKGSQIIVPPIANGENAVIEVKF